MPFFRFDANCASNYPLSQLSSQSLATKLTATIQLIIETILPQQLISSFLQAAFAPVLQPCSSA